MRRAGIRPILAPVGTTATAIAITYSLAVVAGLLVAAGIWRSTREDRAPLDTEKAEQREKGWLAIVVAFLIITLVGTILLVPYGESAGPDAQVVTVVARQFGFTIDPPAVEAGRPVEFRMTTEDTTHAFAVTTRDNRLLFQAQIVPEHTQHLVHTFDEPGTYKVVCYEYCGVGHHVMLASVEVR